MLEGILYLQVFTPLEKVENPVLINLLFCQIVQDVYAGTCVRIQKDDKIKMKNLLGECVPYQMLFINCCRVDYETWRFVTQADSRRPECDNANRV